jgi:hypothetical protein
MTDSNAAPSHCCPPTRVIPALVKPDEYTPVGTIITLPDTDIEVYVTGTEHAGNGRAIVVMQDILGWQSGRHMNIADQLAESVGALVVLPDLYKGDKLTWADLGSPRIGEFLKVWSLDKWVSFEVRYSIHLVMCWL